MTISSTVGRFTVAAMISGALTLATIAGAAAQGGKSAPAGNGEFDGSAFSCLNYTNGLGDNASTKAQSMLARLWMQGYLAGYYKGQGKLEMSAEKGDDDKLASLMLQKCREYPQVSILTVSMQAIAKEAHKIPNTAPIDFSPANYTCAMHVDAKKGSAADAAKSDLAELWAFAFIQGFKNVAQADMVIPMDNKPVLTGAVGRNCEKNRDMKYMDLTALVAEKVKLQ